MSASVEVVWKEQGARASSSRVRQDYRRLSVRRVGAIAVAAAMLLGGCAKTPKQAAARQQPTVKQSGGSTGRETSADIMPDAPTPQNLIDRDDPCDAKLHDICGMLLQFWVINQRLPTRLEDLKSFAEFDQSTDFRCPLANEPYVYLPQAGQTRGDSRLVVYAPGKLPNGRHPAILMKIPQKGQKPSVGVTQLTDAELERQIGLLNGAPATPAKEPAKEPAKP